MRVIRSFLMAVSLLAAQSPERLLDQGIEQFHKGQYTEAHNSLRRAAALSPADARCITWLAIVRANLGVCDGDSTDELRLQATRNSDVEIRRLAGIACIRCLLRQNRFAEMIPLLGQLQKAFPDDADVLYQAVEVYNRAANFNIYDLFQKSPASFRVNQLSAEMLETQGKYAEAAAQYRKALEKNPVALSLHYRLGRVLLLESQDPAAMEAARQEFDEELKLNPSDAAAEYQIGLTFLAQQPKEAAEHFEKALGIAPRLTEALIALGKLRLKEREHAEAIELLERAVKTQPGLESAHYNLMLAYSQAGKRKEAQREQKELDKLRRPQ